MLSEKFQTWLDNLDDSVDQWEEMHNVLMPELKALEKRDKELYNIRKNVIKTARKLTENDGYTYASTMTSLEGAISSFCNAVGLKFKDGFFMNDLKIYDELDRLEKDLDDKK
jgi:hypothetical protein